MENDRPPHGFTAGDGEVRGGDFGRRMRVEEDLQSSHRLRPTAEHHKSAG